MICNSLPTVPGDYVIRLWIGNTYMDHQVTINGEHVPVTIAAAMATYAAKPRYTQVTYVGVL